MNYATAYSNAAPKTAFTVAAMGAPIELLDKSLTYLKNVIVTCDGAVYWTGTTLYWSGTISIWFNDAAGLAKKNTIAAGNIALSDNEFVYVDLSETNNAALTAAKLAITTASASNFITFNRLVLGYRNTTDDEFYPVALAGVMTRQDKSQVVTCADAVTINWGLGNIARMTFDRATAALTLSNGRAGKAYQFLVTQGDGSDTLTYTTTIKWSGAAAPTLSTAAGAIDLLTFWYIGTAWYGKADFNFA